MWTLKGSHVTLAPTAARTLARKLAVKSLPRTLGTLKAAPVYAAAPGACKATTQGGAALDPGTGEPPVKPRPAGALNVVSATVTWHVRDSFIQYIASGEGTSTANGATGDPPTGDAQLVYGFHFAPTAAGATRTPVPRGSRSPAPSPSATATTTSTSGSTTPRWSSTGRPRA